MNSADACALHDPPKVDWERYSRSYDLLLEHSPAYREILDRFEQLYGRLVLPGGACVAELGAGTGNFSVAAARLKPWVNVIHMDSDPGMNAVARDKARAHGLTNFTPVEASADAIEVGVFAPLHAVILIHALYTFPDPQRVLRLVYSALEPGGALILCDLGRVLNLVDWAWYLFREVGKREGIGAALRVFWKGRELSRQNRQIRASQLNGTYWTHSTEECAEAVRAAGFQVEEVSRIYRGYSDLVIARKR